MKLTININDAMNVIVSRPCDACDVMVPTDEHCGDDGQYLCPDCYGQQRADQMYIHDWLIFLDEDNPIDCPIAIHKDVIHPDRLKDADCSTPDPEQGVSRLGPGCFASSIHSIEDLFFDVTHVYTLMDEGFITRDGANQIFKDQGGAK